MMPVNTFSIVTKPLSFLAPVSGISTVLSAINKKEKKKREKRETEKTEGYPPPLWVQ